MRNKQKPEYRFVTLDDHFEELKRIQKEKRDSIRKSMVKIISDYPNLIIFGEDNGAIQQEIDRAWLPLQAEIENIRKNKADLTKIEKDKELSPIEEKANNLAMDEVLEWLQAPYRSLWSWHNWVFKFWHEQDINQFCKEFEYRYMKAFNKTKKEITSNFCDTMFPSGLRDTVLDFDKDNTAQSLYFKLENLYQHYKGDLQQVPSEIVDNIKKDLKELLKYMKKIPFQNEIVEYAIERCIDHLKDQNQLDTVSTLKDFITNFLSPLSTQGFERVKESFYEENIETCDKLISVFSHHEYKDIEHCRQSLEGETQKINQLMRIKLGAFNRNLAKSIYLEKANQDRNDNLKSLTYSQAATIARIIYVNAPNLESDIATTSKIITKISLKILRSKGITQEDIQSLVDHIAGSNIAHKDVSSTWNSNLKSNDIHSALDIVKSLADTLTTDRTCIDTAILDYEGIFDKENIGLNAGCFFNARKKEIRGNREDSLGNALFSCIEP